MHPGSLHRISCNLRAPIETSSAAWRFDYSTWARAHLARAEDARADFADLEQLVPEFNAPLVPAAIYLEADFLAVCLAHEKPKHSWEPTPRRLPSRPCQSDLPQAIRHQSWLQRR
jgi:hypothetical protein